MLWLCHVSTAGSGDWITQMNDESAGLVLFDIQPISTCKVCGLESLFWASEFAANNQWDRYFIPFIDDLPLMQRPISSFSSSALFLSPPVEFVFDGCRPRSLLASWFIVEHRQPKVSHLVAAAQPKESNIMLNINLAHLQIHCKFVRSRSDYIGSSKCAHQWKRFSFSYYHRFVSLALSLVPSQ